MNEVLIKKELVARPRELGAVACAGCPFAELGCPKQGTGECPPPEVVEAKQVRVLLEDDRFDTVWATNDGFQAVRRKPSEGGAILSLQPPTGDRRRQATTKTERHSQPERQKPRPARKRGQSVGEFVATLLLPGQKAT